MNARFAKSSWISCGAASALVLVFAGWLLVTPEIEAKKRKTLAAEELINFLLNPEHSQWMVGAVARIATDEEIRTYLGLTEDPDAVEFQEAFWNRRRSSEVVWPAPQPQGVYETRAKEADTLYTEGARPGRRTDRGTIYILYGEPEEVNYEVSERPLSGPIEVWAYAKDSEAGLDGESPERHYYFVQQGENTVETKAPRRQRLRPRNGDEIDR